ncbi:FAD-binding oxidoreductase [Pseudokineococcus basanitobsidens]|uniref:FAD-binding oxidoreductase n=1 Tax=Pseudokineococcus basanitobsidens TaxID=1926649 RepID=A0ABU8RKR9_9ACTN
MVERADVVVVGGGVVGTSAAFHLARAGLDVVLLERGALGGGSSGKPVGGVRAQFSSEVNIALAARSLRAYARFAAEMGAAAPQGIGFRRTGYLFALRDAEHLPAFTRAVELQRSLGVESRVVDAAETARLGVVVDPAPLVAGVWSPDDGVARPGAVLRAYAAAATALGARVRTGCALEGVDVLPGGRARLRTGAGDVEAAAVVVAAGAWSSSVARVLGADLPVRPVRRQIAFAPAPAGLPVPPEALPFTIDQRSCAYWHGDGDGGLLLGWADPDQAEGEDVTVDDGWHAGLRAALADVAPSLASAPLSRGWAGLYEVTPDRDAALGLLAGGAADHGVRVVAAAGFSGHGFLMAPAAGEVVRDLVLGAPTVVDVTPLDPARLAGAASDVARRTELAIV